MDRSAFRSSGPQPSSDPEEGERTPYRGGDDRPRRNDTVRLPGVETAGANILIGLLPHTSTVYGLVTKPSLSGCGPAQPRDESPRVSVTVVLEHEESLWSYSPVAIAR